VISNNRKPYLVLAWRKLVNTAWSGMNKWISIIYANINKWVAWLHSYMSYNGQAPNPKPQSSKP
jgi:hypothetical protein